MSVGANQFALDLKKFGEVSEKQATTILRKIVYELDSSIVLSTPVDTGRARGNWNVSIGAPSDAKNENKFDPSGSGSIAALKTATGKLKLGDTIWFTNNLPYILRLENDSWSKQAPNGMVTINLVRIVTKYGGSVT